MSTIKQISEDRILVTVLGLLLLYSVGATAYIFALSPKLSFVHTERQEALAKAVELEYKLRETTGLTDSDAEFTVLLRQDRTDSNSTQVYIQRTGTEYPIANVPNVYKNHYHPAEIRGGNLFIIRRIEGQTEEYSFQDELWLYDITGNGQRLHVSNGMDFRASPNGEKISINENGSDLKIFDLTTNSISEFTWQELAGDKLNTAHSSEIRNTVLGWDKDGTRFWGHLGQLGVPLAYYSIDISTGAVSTFDVSSVGITGDELEFNTRSGMILFSTHPRFFDVDSAMEFEKSETVVELFTYDLVLNSKAKIAESVSKSFEPKWIDAKTIEYLDPITRLKVYISI